MADLLLAQSPTRQRTTPAFHHNLYGSSSSSSSSSSSGSSPQSSVIESTFHQHLRRATSSTSLSGSSSSSSSSSSSPATASSVSSMTTTTTVTSSLTTSIQSTAIATTQSSSSASSLMNTISLSKAASKESMKRPSISNKCQTNNTNNENDDDIHNNNNNATENDNDPAVIRGADEDDCRMVTLSSTNDNRDADGAKDRSMANISLISSNKNNINQIVGNHNHNDDEDDVDGDDHNNNDHETRRQVRKSNGRSIITKQETCQTMSPPPSVTSNNPVLSENDADDQKNYKSSSKKPSTESCGIISKDDQADDHVGRDNDGSEIDKNFKLKKTISSLNGCDDSETGNLNSENHSEENNRENNNTNNSNGEDNNHVNVSENSIDSNSRYHQDDDGSDFDPSEVLKRMKVELHEDVQMCHQSMEQDDDDHDNEPDNDEDVEDAGRATVDADNDNDDNDRHSQQQKVKVQQQQQSKSDNISGSASIIRGLKSPSASSLSTAGTLTSTPGRTFSPSSLVGHHPSAGGNSVNSAALAAAEYFQKLINFGSLFHNQAGSNSSSASSTTSGIATTSHTDSPTNSSSASLESIAAAATALLSSANNDNNNNNTPTSGNNSVPNSSLDRILMMQGLLFKQFNNNLESSNSAQQDEFQQQISLANLLNLQQQQQQQQSQASSQLSPSNDTRSNDNSKDRFCNSCNIQFISAKTFKVHKELYCSGRHQQSTGPSSSQTASSSSSSSSGSSSTGGTLLSQPAPILPSISPRLAVSKKNSLKETPSSSLLSQSSLFKNIDLSGLRLPQLSSDSNGQDPIYVALSTNPLILVPFVWNSVSNQFVPITNADESQAVINTTKANTSLVYPNGLSPYNDRNKATSPKAPFITTLSSLNQRTPTQINKDNEFGKKRSLEIDANKCENNALDLSGMIPQAKRSKLDDSIDGIADLMQKFTQQLQQQQQPQQKQSTPIPDGQNLESISMFMNLLNGINPQPVPTNSVTTISNAVSVPSTSVPPTSVSSRPALSPSPSLSDPITSAFKDNPLFSQYLAAFLSSMNGNNGNAASISPSIPSPPTPTPSSSGAGSSSVDVVVKQGSSRCVECNIVFYKHENYLAHKELYCASRRNSVTLTVPPEIRSSPRPQSAASAGSAASGLSPASSLIMSPRQMSTKSPRDEQTSPIARETLTASPGSQSNSALTPSPKPSQVLQQFFCSACGIKFTSYDNLTAHQTYYCLKRQQPGTSTGPLGAAAVGQATLPAAVPPSSVSPGAPNPVLTAQQILAGLSASGADLSMLGDPATLSQQIALMAAAFADNAKNDVPDFKPVKEISKPDVMVKPAVAPTSSAAALQTYKCTICGYKGHTMRGMRTHVRVHTQELSESGAYEEDFIVANTDIPDPPGPRARGQSGLGKQQQQARRKSSTNDGEDLKKIDGKPETEPLSSAQMHSCQFCRYTSNYKGNVIRHIKLVHKDIASAQMAINLALQQQILASDLLLTPEMSLLINPNPPESSVTSEPEKSQSPDKDLTPNGKQAIIKPEVKLEIDDAPLSDSDNDGRHCASCNISFTYRNSYLAHKKYYCTAVQGTSEPADEAPEVDS